MGRSRRAASEERIEREEEDGSRRILRIGIVAVEQGVSPTAVEHRRVDAVDAEMQVEPDPRELERTRHAQQRDEA
jgi:hypothetical protein